MRHTSCLWGLAVCCICLFLYLPSATAEDLAVQWVTATPSEGQAGDSVTLEGRIANNGPGDNYAVQYRWYLSSDAEITIADTALGPENTLPQALYAGSAVTVSQPVTLPAFPDPEPPSYIGLIVDPYGWAFDPDRSNNTGSAAFTFTGDPPHGFYDTVGDNYLDVIHVSAVVSGGDLTVAVTFAQPPASTISLLMGIDMDQDSTTTGLNTSLPGTEAMVSLVYQTYDSVVTLETDAGEYTLTDAVLNGNTLTYTFPMIYLNNDTAMDLFWAVDHAVGPTADFDRAPDVGSFTTDSETVVVRRPGDGSIDVSVTDPAAQPGEDDFPDIRRLDARVVGDQLRLTLTYAHDVDVEHVTNGHDGLFVWIDLDSDSRLATGFANTGQTPPTMGVDHQLRLQIDDLAGIVPELLKDADGDGEPETSPMGLPFNDMFMRLAENQIQLAIPLVYLGAGDGGGAIAVTNLNTRDIFDGTIDRLPDSGAWDLKNNAQLSKQGCLATSQEINDPVDDSLYGAGGLDNDELVHVSVCLGNQALIFSIDYESYLLSNDGATLIYLDTDRNPATGWVVTNLAEDTTIGADYVLRSYWDTIELKQKTHLYRITPEEALFAVDQFATPTQANRLYLTLPLESIGEPTRPVDILVRTASWGGGGSGMLLPNDDLPDHGLVTLATLPHLYLADFDGDGDVDGLDLYAWMTSPGGVGLHDVALHFGR